MSRHSNSSSSRGHGSSPRRQLPRAPTLPPSSSPSPRISSSPYRSSTDVEEKIRRLERMNASLKAKVDAQEKGKKRSRSEANVTEQTLGRGLPKVVDMFTPIQDLIALGDTMDELEDIPLPENPTEDELEERRVCKRARASLAVCPSFIPNFTKTVDDATPEQLKTWCAALQSGSVAGRSTDVLNIREAVAGWINDDFTPKPSPTLKAKTRAGRGLQHNVCGLLLSSVEHDWADPEVREKIRSREEGFELGPFARALYQAYKGDAEDLEKGYLRSPLLLKVFKHIFTSPSSADSTDMGDDDENTVPTANKRTRKSSTSQGVRKSVSSGLGMKGKVTSRSIAYAAVQLLFALTDALQWCEEPLGLNLREVYYYIVDFFDDETPTSVELLRWWKLQVFPAQSVRVSTGPKPRDKLAAQRARKAALSNRN